MLSPRPFIARAPCEGTTSQGLGVPQRTEMKLLRKAG